MPLLSGISLTLECLDFKTLVHAFFPNRVSTVLSVCVSDGPSLFGVTVCLFLYEFFSVDFHSGYRNELNHLNLEVLAPGLACRTHLINA